MKCHLKKLLLRSRVPGMLVRIGPTSAVILRYHSIQPVPGDYFNTIGEGIIHSETEFAEQMELVASRFHPVTIDDIVMWLEGQQPLPKRAVAITFDDGFADNCTIAAPILARYGVPAAFYLTVRSIGTDHYPWFCRLRHAFFTTSVPRWESPEKKTSHSTCDEAGRLAAFREAARKCATLTGDPQDVFLDTVERELEVVGIPNGSALMMNWDQVAALKLDGHIIGSHTMTHPNTAHAAPEEVRDELKESKAILEQRLGVSIRHFSYPSPILQPHCSPETRQLVDEAGYLTATTCLPGAVRRHHDPLCLPRVSAPQNIDDFQWALEASLAGRVL